MDEHTLTTIISRIRKKSKQRRGNILRQLMEWAISGSAVSLDEAAKFIRQGIFEKNCGGDSAHCRFAAVDFFLLTKDVRVVICGIILIAAFYIWGMVFLHYFQKKLSLFTDGLCQTLDHMMDSTDRPQVDYEAETLLSRISHRLERLYNVMQKPDIRQREKRKNCNPWYQIFPTRPKPPSQI